MSKLMRKIVTVMLIVVAVFCFVGCSGVSEDTETDDDQKDWAQDYGTFSRDEYFTVKEMGNDNVISFKASRGVHVYEAEDSDTPFSTVEAEYTTDRYAKKDGDHVSYFGAGECMTFHVKSESACNVLVVLNIGTAMPTDPAEPFSGAPGADVFTVTCGEQTADTSYCYVEPTGGWNSYVEIYVGELRLAVGDNDIKVNAKMSFQVDYMALAPKLTELDRAPLAYDGTAQIKVRCFETNGKISGCQMEKNTSLGYYILGKTSAMTQVEFYIEADKAYSFVPLTLNAAFGHVGDANSNADPDDDDDMLFNRIGCAVNDRNVNVDPGFYPSEDGDGNITAVYDRRKVNIAAGSWWLTYGDVLLANIDLKPGTNKIVVMGARYGEYNLNYITIG